jgi:Tol biopolymer transport system component
MKKILIAAMAVLAILDVSLSITGSAQQAADPGVLLRAAIEKEEVDGDLNGAISLYKQIITNNGNKRAVAAKALLRLGGCYEKQGNAAAAKAYEQLLRDYVDQAEEAKEAQSRLAALNKPAGKNGDSTLATRLVWVTGNPGNCRNAASPDGKYVTYIDDSGNLAIRDLKAETSRLLTNEGTMDSPYQSAYSSRWSHDGKQIAYNWDISSKNGSEIQLRVLALEDPQPRIVFRGDQSKGAWVEPQDWSPDGKQILVRTSLGGQADQLALIPVQGGSPKVIETIESGVVSPGMAFFSPDGRYAVYDRLPGNVAASDLFIVDVTEGGETPLVRHPADDRILGWSPDGNWILFLSDRSGTAGLWVIRVSEGKPQGSPLSVRNSVSRITPLGFAKDGSFYYMDIKGGTGDICTAGIDFETGKLITRPEKAIRRYEGWNMAPRYSPDGKSLAYISKRGLRVAWPPKNGNALCIHSLESGIERVFMDEFVSFGIHSLGAFRWSPDSRSVVVRGQMPGGNKPGFYLLSLDTGKISTLIESSPDILLLRGGFAQDGRHFLYMLADKKQGIRKIQALDLRNGEERELYRSERELLWGPSVSPDGKWLAFVTDRLTLSVIPTGGGIPRTMHRFDQLNEVWEPEWTPDGKYILFGTSLPEGREGKILYKIPVEGGKPQEIVFPQEFTREPTVHPDGRRIAFECVEEQPSEAEVWVIQNFLPK